MEPTVIPILDHGQVVLLDVFGSDARIAEAARVSYGQGTTKTSNDKSLIRYLMRHRHTSPFEMVETLFYLKVPITVARQLVRHRTANINEVSGRYSELPNEIYVPEVEQLGPQSTQNNQGRAASPNDIRTRKAKQSMWLAGRDAYEIYDSLLHTSNVSREISRGVLPLHTYTSMYWKCDLHNFFHFCKLRMDSHAQYEIRVMATAMFDAVCPHFPLATEAFRDYILQARTLSHMEQQLLCVMLREGSQPSLEYAKALGLSEREYNEFTTWIETMQVSAVGDK